MQHLKLISDRNIPKDPNGKPAAAKQRLVQMGSASKKTRGIGRGIEFGGFPRGA
jgi:hypothetical protein